MVNNNDMKRIWKKVVQPFKREDVNDVDSRGVLPVFYTIQR